MTLRVNRRRAARRGPCRPALPRRTRSAAGFTLVEVLVAVVLAGVVILTLAGALLTVVRATRSTSDRQELQLALGNYSERLKAIPYLECGDVPAYRATMLATTPPPVRPGTTVEIVRVRYWDPATRSYVAGCVSPAADGGTQRVTVRVEWQGRSVQGQIVKRDGRDTP